jgi:uncharacterized protein YcaQ
VLLVQSAHPEDGINAIDVASRLAAELVALSDWLDLRRIKVRKRGKFARLLAHQLRSEGNAKD